MDRRAIQDHGVPGLALMECAGASAYDALRAAWPDRRHLCVLCGGGNNGGDGYVIAELARRDGLVVDVLALSDPGRLRGDAATVASRYAVSGVIAPFQGELPDGCDMVVDAMLGTGLQRPVEGEYREAVEAVNASGLPVMAVDIPSGIHGGTGAVLGAAVRADVTPTFIGLKAGLFTGDGPGYAGRVVYDGLDVPAAVYEGIEPAARRTGYDGLRHRFPRRERTAHKGRYGHVLVVGGDAGMGGAALMAARAAARCGAGLVSVVTRREHAPGFLAAQPELMVHGEEQLAALLQRASVVVLGPGLGRSDWGQAVYREARGFPGPQVLDADALNALADAPDHHDSQVLTPHPGEAGRLLGLTSAQVQEDRFAAVHALGTHYGGVAVLKGAGTLVQGADQPPALCTDGNPGMASGGMGDVLSGIIGSLIAQGFSPVDAAEAGVCLHAAAADRAAGAGERGLLATDLLVELRALLNPS
ncbi:NAD(P)H-hydrate epimerase [Aquisalimonas asiatica]|uniref:Bifunctional NAD(P)H-hydrate repair enzyme n=2 Tax=Aquisalimonas asiatica TaxID=406100 RepID=A0A1H8R0N4_9GAMM|nr:NAD(P)H-hydrate epimerase [Aquisalimonas asiatica]